MKRATRDSDSDRRWTVIAVVVLVIAGVAAYANSLAGVFLYDDFDAITLNPHIRQLWPLGEAMSRPLKDAAETVSTRPVLSLTFALNHRLLGAEAWGFHVVNLLIHVAAGLLLFAVLRATLGRPAFGQGVRDERTGLALTVALLWLVHPLHTSSVTYIVQRAESLAGMMLLLIVYLAIRAFDSDRPARWQLAAFLVCALGMATKETVAAAPLIVLAYDGVFVSPGYAAALRARPRWYAALAATWLIVVALLAPDTGELVGEGQGLAYALTQPGVILHYLRLSLWPHPLVLSYEWPLAGSLSEVLPAATVVAALGALTAWAIVRRHWTALLGVTFFAVLAPSSSVFGLTQRIMEHRMYVPLAAVVVAVVVAGRAALLRLGANAPATTRTLVGRSLVAACALLLAATTYARNADYHDEVGFWLDNVAKRPDNYIAHMQLGRAYMKANDHERARTSFAAALAIEPHFSHLLIDMGRAELVLGDQAAARARFEAAIAADPTLALAHNNLGFVLEQQGVLDAAKQSYERALALQPDLELAAENLGRVRRRLGLASRGRGELLAELERTPTDAATRTELGRLLEREGHAEAALAEYERAVADAPDLVIARNALATLLARRGDAERATVQFREALRLEPDNVDAHSNLGALLAMQGRIADAIVHFEKVQTLEPGRPLSNFNLGLAHTDIGNLDVAMVHFRREVRINPGFALGHLRLAATLEQRGDLTGAMASYERALQLAPELAEARAGLDRVQAARGAGTPGDPMAR